jgi:PAS domain S-box-containing protein
MSLNRKDTALLEHAFSQAPIGKALVGLDGRWLQVNRSLCELLGYSESELLAVTFREITYPDDLALDETNVRELIDGRASAYRMEKRYVHRSGEVVWALLDASLVRDEDGGPLFFVAQIQDISERKRMEERLAENERMFRLLTEHSADIIARHDHRNVCLYVSPSCRRILGYDPEELIGTHAFDFLHPEDAAALESDASLPAVESDERLLVFRARKKDGAYVWLESSSNVLRGEAGDMRETISVLRDVTAQRRYLEENDRLRDRHERIEEHLQRSEDNYRNLVDEFPEAIVLAQGDRWIYANDAAVRLLGAGSREELLHRNLHDIIHPDFHDRIERRMQTVERGREHLEPMEEKFVHMNGEPIDVEVVCIPAVYEKVEVRCLLIRNSTERKRTQELIVHSEKLAVAGQFAAAIAHEIRNPLTAIKGFLQLLMRDVTDKSRFFDIIFSEMSRIEMITNELLILAKPQAVKFAKRDIRFLMQQVVSFMDAQANMNNVLLQVDYGPSDLLVLCDENQLKQVFINFLKNAIEAMPDGGLMKIHMSRSVAGVSTVRFTDQGTGMPEEMLEKLGEPFYTTKETGTGLGLMVTKRIVQQHGGDVRFSSKVGEGTTVELTLPTA